jgi:pilus assembly protein CpaB
MAQVVGRLAKFDLDSGIPLTASMLVSSAEQLSTAGSVAALTIPRGYVAVSIPISRLSSVSYAPRPGDHVSVIMTMMFVDLDSEFQTILPNQTSGVLAPGPGVIIGTNVSDGTEGGSGGGQQSFQTWGSAEQNILSSFITAQIASGGALAIQGRTEVDSLLNELFFVVPSERQRARIVSQTLLNDAMVLQVGDFSLPEEEEEEQQPPEELAEVEQQAVSQEETAEVVQPEEPKPPDVITLVVTPQDAVTINYLIYSGAELTLALRAAEDDSLVDTEAATLQYLLDEYNVAVPVKLPYGMEPRRDSLTPPVLQNDVQTGENP